MTSQKSNGDPSYIVLRRPFDGNPDRSEEPRWERIGYAPSRSMARKLAAYPRMDGGLALGFGDLMSAVAIEGVNPLMIHQLSADMYVTRRNLSVVRAPRLPASLTYLKTWFAGWEGENATADAMLETCSPVGKLRTVMAAAMCVKQIASYAGNNRDCTGLMGLVSDWIRHRGASMNNAISYAVYPVRDFIMQSYKDKNLLAAHAAGAIDRLADAALSASPAACAAQAASAVRHAAQAAAELECGTTIGVGVAVVQRELRLMTPLVRAYIPLSIRLLAGVRELVPVSTANWSA